MYSLQTNKQATNFSVHKITIKEHSIAEYYKYNNITTVLDDTKLWTKENSQEVGELLEGSIQWEKTGK